MFNRSAEQARTTRRYHIILWIEGVSSPRPVEVLDSPMALQVPAGYTNPYSTTPYVPTIGGL